MRVSVVRLVGTAAAVTLLGSCGGGARSSDAASAGSDGIGGGTGGGAPVPVAGAGLGGAVSELADCGGAIVNPTTRAVDAAEYVRQARRWDRATIDCRLGPSFDELEPGRADPRPTAYEPEHRPASDGYLCPSYELAGACESGCDYGSTAGQVLYAPEATNAPGVERIQNYAYEKGRICESIQSGSWLGGPRPDPAIAVWTEALGRALLVPNGFAQTEFWQTNGGIMIFPEGLVGATGNQTSGDSKPFFKLPPNKVPTAVAVSSYNEFAFVAIWDTEAVRGELAVFALRADTPEAFSVPYFALPNEAGFKAIHWMGNIELPEMATPTAIAVSGDNGNTPGGHVPGFEYGNREDPTKNILTSAEARNALAREDYERRVAMAGQLIVASRWENKISFIDLRPLMQFVRGVYFGSDDQRRQAAAAPSAWPFTFANAPEAKPVVVTTLATPHPTVLRIGNQPSTNEQGLRRPLKAWVGNLRGELRVYDVSSFAHDAPRPIPAGSITEIAKLQAGRNLTSMTRQGGQAVLVVSRGDQRVDWVGIADDDPNTLKVLRTLRDSRIEDVVLADVSDRGPVVTLADFSRKRLLNYRFGPTEDNAGKPPANFGCSPDGADRDCEAFEFGGAFDLPGSPFFVGTTNVN